MTGLSGLLAAAAVFVWAGAVAFWSRRWAVWAVAIFALVAFHFWQEAIHVGRADRAVWVAGAFLAAGVVAVILLMLRYRASEDAE